MDQNQNTSNPQNIEPALCIISQPLVQRQFNPNQTSSNPIIIEPSVCIISQQPIQPQLNPNYYYPQQQIPQNYNQQIPRGRNYKIPSLKPYAIIGMSLASLFCFFPVGIAVTILLCVSVRKFKQLERTGSVVTKIEAETLAVRGYRLFVTSVILGFVFILTGVIIGVSLGFPYLFGSRTK